MTDARRGWVALVGPELEENLSLRSLAAVLRRSGFGVEILAFNDGSQLSTTVARIAASDDPPLLVGLSLSFQWRATDVLALAVGLRAAGYRGHVTAGGHFGTFAALEVLRDFPEFDSVCRQEAEETIVALAECVAGGSSWLDLAGLAVRSPEGPRLNAARAVPDLAALPWPVRDGEPAQAFGHRIAPLVSSRGCYANCTFCCIAAWHEQALPGKRYRARPLEDVADELAWLHHERKVDIFVFHDDDFFLASGVKNVARINRLADLLDARGVQRFATVVKARPTDAQPEVFRALVERLHCLRAYVGIETDADQGLHTLRRWAQRKHNHAALELAESLGLFVSFNLLLFDPDTTLESLESNLAFLSRWAHVPFNFGRVELYAGTPLLARMQQEGRARGDWVQWDYALHDDAVERVFSLTMRAFETRNFAPDAVVTTVMGVRADVEVVRRFRPAVFAPRWVEQAKALSRTLGQGSVSALSEIVARVKTGEPRHTDQAWATQLAARLEREANDVRAGCLRLVQELRAVAPEGESLTHFKDDRATTLQPTHPELRL